MDSFFQHLDYADDICLLSHKMFDLQDMICSLEKEAASAGLKINGGKRNCYVLLLASTELLKLLVFKLKQPTVLLTLVVLLLQVVPIWTS